MSHRRPSLDNTRRHFLRGVGVALALPWLESMPWAGSSAEAAGLPAGAAQAAAKAGPPLRMGIVFFSNGVEPAHWWAKGSGATMELGPGLTPMLPHREDMVFIRGLFNQSAFVSTSPHLGRMNVLAERIDRRPFTYDAPVLKRSALTGESGTQTTIVRVDVDREGIVRGVVVIVPSADPAYDATLARRLDDDRYQPARLGPQPVAASVFRELHH